MTEHDTTPEPAAWTALVGPLSTLADGTLRGVLDFEPAFLSEVAAHLGVPGTVIALSPVNGLYSIVGISRGIRKTLTDGTVRVLYDVDHTDRWRAWPLLGMPRETIVVAVLRDSTQRFSGSSPYGDYAQALWRSRFLLRPRVWLALGGLPRYQEFIQKRACAQPGTSHRGEVSLVTLQENPYWCLPLCATHKAYGPNPNRWPGGAAQAKRLLEMHWGEWAHHALVETLGQSRLRETPPSLIQSWADRHGLAEFLPPCPPEEIAGEDLASQDMIF